MRNSTLILVMVLSISLLELTSQTLTNNGSTLTITNGSSLDINGDFKNLDDGSIDNSGDIYLAGDWTNDATSGNLLQGTTGTVSLNSTSTQIIGGTTQTWFNNLDIESDVSLATAATSISGQLHLSGSSLALNNSNLIIENTASISGVNASGYIVADGNGRLVQEVGNSNTNFPIGTATSFVPLILNNAGTADNYGVRVFADVLDGGNTGTTIPEIDNCVNMTWDIVEQINGDSDLSITPYWSSTNEGSSFDRSEAGLGHYTTGNWDPQAAQNGSGSAPHSITRTGITSLSTFAVGDINSPMAIALDVIVDLKTLLEGPFNGTEMNTDISNIIALSQPYNTSPWNYTGTENVVSIPNVDIVDWVLIELRDASGPSSADPSTIISRQAGFVLKDGSVVSSDGVSDMQFDATISQNLYVVVFHRNHLGIISANPLTLSGGVYDYDFSSAAYQALGGSPPQKEIASGVYGMFGGDINADGIVNDLDKTAAWNTEVGKSGYVPSDCNLDGQADNLDKNDIWLNNITKESQVPD